MYTKKSFNQCLFNPLTEGPLLKEYPRLSEIVDPAWADDANLDAVLRYVITLFDPNSPVIKDDPDLNYRKSSAADVAQLPIELRDSVYDHTHPYAVELTVKFLLRFARSKEFAALCAVEYCFWEGVRKLMSPISADNSKAELESVQKKATLKDELDKDIKKLDLYYRNFFGEDELLEKKIKRRGFTPESIGINV